MVLTGRCLQNAQPVKTVFSNSVNCSESSLSHMIQKPTPDYHNAPASAPKEIGIPGRRFDVKRFLQPPPLVLALLLTSMSTASADASSGQPGFRVGFAKQDITPQAAMPMWGYGDRQAAWGHPAFSHNIPNTPLTQYNSSVHLVPSARENPFGGL